MASFLRGRQNLKERLEELIQLTQEWINTERDHTKAIRELRRTLKELKKSL